MFFVIDFFLYCICTCDSRWWIFTSSQSAGVRFTFTRTNTKPFTTRTAYKTNENNRCCVNVNRLDTKVRKKQLHNKCIVHATQTVTWHAIHLSYGRFFRTSAFNRFMLSQHRFFSFVFYAVRVVSGIVFVRVNVMRAPAEWDNINIHCTRSYAQMQH